MGLSRLATPVVWSRAHGNRDFRSFWLLGGQYAVEVFQPFSNPPFDFIPETALRHAAAFPQFARYAGLH